MITTIHIISGAGPVGAGVAPGALHPKIGKNMILWRKSSFFTRITPTIFAPPFAIGKNMIFGRKIVIFHTKYPK
jgi:hypothetical protein